MGQPTYSYSAEAIIAGITAIRNAHNKIDTALDQLESYSNGQLATWDGDARAMYTQYKLDWDGHVDKMKSIMTTNAIPSLERILDNYDLTERFNSRTWQDG
ncbi:uncharacterized protein YukE [Allocatelliglobosispora scoriae]|uniref:Uncharacterized protein YukE n=1 Tax=Allocatelliglobosispora scoriae TaxID=643052 RepID=A0A841C4X5_9ACTN|nr:hypothetical protein [Allocatelliglobosispora scoriae]MBB5874193.1 uncharacterized protein YukE [Allocatelliglobosispora scoriae]